MCSRYDFIVVEDADKGNLSVHPLAIVLDDVGKEKVGTENDEGRQEGEERDD